MNLSCNISPGKKRQVTLVIIDARYSIYEHRSKSEIIYSNLLKQFIVYLKEYTNFVFCFFHKDQKKNQKLIKQFKEYCSKNQIKDYKSDQILGCDKKSINQYIINRIKDFMKTSSTITPFDIQRSRGNDILVTKTLESLDTKNQNIILITHNPITFKFANVLSEILKDMQFKYFNVALILFSSFFQNQSKKQLIEEHFYNYNFKSSRISNCYFDHISILNQIIPYLGKGFAILRNKYFTTVGYYFYPKKLYDLVLKEILNSTVVLRMIPIDFRFHNSQQYKHLNTLLGSFPKDFGLKQNQRNKIQSIRSHQHERKLQPTNQREKYFKVSQYQQQFMISIDPIHTIPIIGERQKFADKFSEIINSFKFKQFLKDNRITLDFQVPKQLILYKDQEHDGKITKQFKFPIIVKSLEACFTSNCHIMSIVVNEQAFEELKKDKNFKQEQSRNYNLQRGNLIIQEIINHDQLIYKVYCIGKQVIIQKRKSIPNITLENFKIEKGFHIFDSQKNLFDEVRNCLYKSEDNNYQNTELDHEKDLNKCLQILSELISESFEVKLFGYDLIGDLKKRQFYLIDINHFPGYKNVNKIKDMFDSLFLEQIQ